MQVQKKESDGAIRKKKGIPRNGEHYERDKLKASRGE